LALGRDNDDDDNEDVAMMAVVIVMFSDARLIVSHNEMNYITEC